MWLEDLKKSLEDSGDLKFYENLAEYFNVSLDDVLVDRFSGGKVSVLRQLGVDIGKARH